MLSVIIMLSVIKLKVTYKTFMLSIVLLNVVMLSVVPRKACQGQALYHAWPQLQ
jgi:hypothetical protein